MVIHSDTHPQLLELLPDTFSISEVITTKLLLLIQELDSRVIVLTKQLDEKENELHECFANDLDVESFESLYDEMKEIVRQINIFMVEKKSLANQLQRFVVSQQQNIITAKHECEAFEGYCFCDQIEGEMLECSSCHQWYHLNCLRLKVSQIQNVDKWICPACTRSKLGH
eukprot:TRINITY_DN2569_c0_g2_i1.p1 TRINITY_DN2569_c0_g2~~TRINITY_DN2569_c0_g2_i1.p1  ORF type:complete len:170 (+),score=43.81 TRINITY_DN2569_c0_g2_i1:48-557(+)